MPTAVLVVDDDPAVCELDPGGCVPGRACSAYLDRQCPARGTPPREAKFDAVFLDVRMPPPGGIELAGQMQASGINQRTPVIMITAEDDPAVLKLTHVVPYASNRFGRLT